MICRHGWSGNPAAVRVGSLCFIARGYYLKTALFTSLLLILLVQLSFGQNLAQRRSEKMGLGMNLSYLDNWWKGTKEKHYSDFAKPEEAAKRAKEFADIAKAGFKTVRIPICFSAWMRLDPPYDWDNPKGPEMADLFVKAALAANLNVIIDLHHSEFDGKVPAAASTERIVALWTRIANRYKDTDPERVFFELRNEPHDIKADDWRQQAVELIKAVRSIAPRHTLIVGFHDWNSRQALIDSKPFDDKNIIYTFHYYDPFLFTHQGSTWTGTGGLNEMKSVPFPFVKEKMPKTPQAAKGKWVENLIGSYAVDSGPEKMFNDLKAAKDWSVKYKVPIFAGEFGSYSEFAAMDDRCRHAMAVYSAFGKLQIPNTWWEWDGGFNMFAPGTTQISDCMRKALDSYTTQN